MPTYKPLTHLVPLLYNEQPFRTYTMDTQYLPQASFTLHGPGAMRLCLYAGDTQNGVFEKRGDFQVKNEAILTFQFDAWPRYLYAEVAKSHPEQRVLFGIHYLMEDLELSRVYGLEALESLGAS